MNKFNRIFLPVTGFLILTFLVIPLPFDKAKAAEGECHLKHCLVPAPTILGPKQGEVVATLRPGIKGLTWKTTVVKVFIDGVEITNIKQIKHADYYGSFYAVPDFDLAPGQHYAYTIAHSENPGWYDQSKESTYIYFTVKAPVVLKAESGPVAGPAVAEPNKTPGAANTVEVSKPEAAAGSIDIDRSEGQPADVAVGQGAIDGGVFVEEGAPAQPTPSAVASQNNLELQGAAGLSDLGEILDDEFAQKTTDPAKRNRIIGLSILALIIIFAIILLATDERRFRREVNRHEDGDLPPAPQPPADRTWSKEPLAPADKSAPAGEQVIPPPIEPTELYNTGQAPKDYFASPPASPHSPYPDRSPKGDRLFDPEQKL